MIVLVYILKDRICDLLLGEFIIIIYLIWFMWLAFAYCLMRWESRERQRGAARQFHVSRGFKHHGDASHYSTVEGLSVLDCSWCNRISTHSLCILPFFFVPFFISFHFVRRFVFKGILANVSRCYRRASAIVASPWIDRLFITWALTTLYSDDVYKRRRDSWITTQALVFRRWFGSTSNSLSSSSPFRVPHSPPSSFTHDHPFWLSSLF